MEVKAWMDECDREIQLSALGSFFVSYSTGSEIHRMLNTKNRERFRVTIERIKP